MLNFLKNTQARHLRHTWLCQNLSHDAEHNKSANNMLFYVWAVLQIAVFDMEHLKKAL